MKKRYRLYRWNEGMYYSFDNRTGKRESLGTRDEHEALEIIHAKNQATRLPAMNLQLARVYLQHSDPGVNTRTWALTMDEIIKTKTGSTRERWVRNDADDGRILPDRGNGKGVVVSALHAAGERSPGAIGHNSAGNYLLGKKPDHAQAILLKLLYRLQTAMCLSPKNEEPR